MFSLYCEAFLRLLYPAHCEVCSKSLELQESYLCASCKETLKELAGPLDEICLDGPFKHLNHVWALYTYVSPFKEILHAIKYRRKHYLLSVFRDAFCSAGQAIASETWYDAILPIPIGHLRLVERTFNQAEVLAEFLASITHVPIRSGILDRHYFSLSQTSLNRIEREVNIHGAFKAASPEKIKGRTFLLIDDVLTTGATTDEAARVLKLHGAKRVDLFTLARSVPEKDPVKNNLRFLPVKDKILV